MNHILSPGGLFDSLARLFRNRETSIQQHDFRTIKLHDYQLVLATSSMKKRSPTFYLEHCRSTRESVGTEP